MKRISLLQMKISDERYVDFNSGQNYVVGSNGSGKTTFFEMIQYILGITKKRTRFFEPVIWCNEPELVCRIGDKEVTVRRGLNSQSIIFEGDINIQLRAGSRKLAELYYELLQPEFNVGDDSKAAIDILRFSFLSEIEFGFSKEMVDILYKVLGINVSYVAQVKRDIAEFEIQIDKEEFAFRELQRYVESVIKEMENKGDNISGIVDVMNNKLLILQNELLNNTKLIYDAKEAFSEITESNNERFKKKLKEEEQYFIKMLHGSTTKRYVEPFRLMDFVKGKTPYFSLGETTFLTLAIILNLVSVREYRDINSIGFLVNDNCFGRLTKSSTDVLRGLVASACNSGELQYIEFSRDSADIPKDKIILNLEELSQR